MKPWAKAATALLVLAIVALAAALVIAAASSGGSDASSTNPVAVEPAKTDPSHTFELELELEREKREIEEEEEEEAELRTKRKHRKNASRPRPKTGPSADGGGTNGTSHPRLPTSAGSAGLEASFTSLQSQVEGEIGVAFAPLGTAPIVEYGGTSAIHAWSSFKVPIVATLTLEEHGHLSAEQESLAASAITASDNAAAASLFSDLEGATGGAAASTIEGVLSQVSEGPTTVATAPPPPGAYSSWGQTEWTLTAATAFYRALACGALGVDPTLALTDMEQVVPEQQWGLGQASFPDGTSVAYKAGWGPDGSESGPYLVRQSGILRSGDTGVAVTIAAQASSGSFEAGVSDLDRVADWVAGNVDLQTGSCE